MGVLLGGWLNSHEFPLINLFLVVGYMRENWLISHESRLQDFPQQNLHYATILHLEMGSIRGCTIVIDSLYFLLPFISFVSINSWNIGGLDSPQIPVLIGIPS